MPRYDFQHTDTGFVKEVTLPHDLIAAFTEEAEEKGWKRLWSAPNVTVVPGYWEAYAEADAVADDPFLGDKPPKPPDFREYDLRDLDE